MKKKKIISKIQKHSIGKYYSYDDFKKRILDVDNNLKSKRSYYLKNTLLDFFKNETEALEKIKKWKPEDKASQALKKVRENTESIAVKSEAERIKKAVTLPGGKVRKQRFVKQKNLSLIAPLTRRVDFSTSELILNNQIKGVIRDGKRLPVTGIGLNSYMERNNIKHIMDIPKVWPKDKSIKVPSWDVLITYLHLFNFKPQEVLDYALMAVAPTKKNKKKFLELRLFREYEKNSKIAINTFVEIYKKHLTTKQPLKVFAISEPFIKWCKTEDLFFNSDENLRQNIKIIIDYWNKDNPTDKLPLKIK